MELNNIRNLLVHVTTLNSRYKKIAELTGENFNVFRILKMEASEVRLHSTFIAELLNPNGSHGQRDLFLKLFVKLFEFKKNVFESEGATVEVEKHIGFISEDQNEGGRIDILITDRRNNHIVIENKIHAGDGIKQLLRYKGYSKKADLFYLTLDSKEPQEYSSLGLKLNIDYKCLSYKSDITSWLEDCRKEVATLPIIRETITQYLHLIKYLNNQSINDTMTEELSSLINSNLQAAFVIANNLDAATDKLLEKFHIDMLDLAEEVKSKGFLLCEDFNIQNRYIGYYFYKPEWKYCSICFSFQEYCKYFIYGVIVNEDPNQILVPVELKAQLESLTGVKSKNIWWPILINMESPYNQDWDKIFEPWEAIANGEMKNIVRRKLSEMMNLIGDLQL